MSVPGTLAPPAYYRPAPPRPPRGAVGRPAGLSPTWLYAFMVVQFVCVGALVFEQLGSLRFAFRICSFVSSLAMLGALAQPAVAGRGDPARSIGLAVLGLLFLMFLHPNTNSPMSGLAYIALAAAIWAPMYWADRIAVTPAVLRRAVLLLWGFNTLSAVVGVLQVYYPDVFMPEPAFVRAMVGEEIADSLKIQLDDGRTIYRPMGLSDSPGGAGSAGMVAFITGLGLAVMERNAFLRALGIVGAAVGVFCLSISQVRSAMVIAGLNALVFFGIMAARGRLDRAAALVVVGGAIVSAGFAWVMALGSEAVASRLETLTDDSAAKVYQQNRGVFLEVTFTEHLPDYPLGAGLGRHGMMYAYFGNKNNADSPSLWAEIQATAWVYDGGLPMLFLGYAAVGYGAFFAVRTALKAKDPVLADAASLIAAMQLGTLVQTFGYSPFVGQIGLMFWLQHGILFAATCHVARNRGRPRPAWRS